MLRRSLLAALGLALALVPTAGAAGPGLRDVLVVGNNWEGTADVVDPHTFEPLTRIDIVPDLEERRAEILADPAAAGYFVAINLLVGEGHDQYVDDAFTSHDGRYLYVSRPSLADVVAFDLSTREIVWRTKVDGYRSDHMAISPDGRTLLVSASTGNVVHAIDTATGAIVGGFESGDSPHENNYSADGKRIFHASIGLVYTPADEPALDSTKGDRWFQVVDADTYEILKRIDVGKALADAGYDDMSSAVRPMAIAPDERYVYMQLSFLHGFVEFDLQQDKPLRVALLPVSDEAKSLRREEYLLDSAHHGLAINPQGTKLCVAGTMSDYAAIVHRTDFSHRIASEGQKPYWATNSADGRYCFVSYSGDDRVSVISYATEKEIASIPVGDHPQRMRTGVMRAEYLPPDEVAPKLSDVKVIRRKRRRALRVTLSEPATLRVAVSRRRAARERSGRAARARRFARLRVLRRQLGSGTSRVPLRRLRRGGRYRLVIRASDPAGNRSARKTARFRVRVRR
jgi:YVTN family beta-propeller protein